MGKFEIDGRFEDCVERADDSGERLDVEEEESIVDRDCLAVGHLRNRDDVLCEDGCERRR